MNTIYCLNPGCLHPNPSHFQYCHRCGNRLILKERYIPRSILGQGSFCRTFLANDTDKPSQPFCVIKQFLPQAQGTDTIENASQLFAQEAERLEELGKHSQIPDLIAYFIVNNRQYLIQEFVNGDTLKEELDQNGTFSEPQIREILLEVLEILDFVHSKQVIHRDINPENMIISTVDNKLFIVDFGSAKVVKKPHINVDGTIIGSAEYCAPEQSLGKPLLVSDLYGLGVTCMHLLTGVSPFDLYDTINNRWIWRDYLNGKVVSEELGNIIDKLAHQMPKHRYQSAQEVINALNPSVLEIVTPKPPPVSTQLSVNNETISNIYDHPIPVNFAIASSEPTLPKINFSGESKLVPESSPQIAQKQKASTAISPWKSFWQNAGLVICLVGIAVVGVNTFRDNSTTEPTARSDTSSQYNRPLEIDINDATVYYSRGLTHRRQGNYEAAIADYNRAIEINPNYALAYNNRGFAHRRQGNYEAAIADYNRAIEINPNYALAYNNRGFAHRRQGNYEAAIADYNRAIEINPNYALAYNGRGLTHRRQGNYEAAIADYNRAIEINPNYALAYNNRGFAHRRQGNYEAAIADYNRAIEINPNYALAYNNRGFAHRSQGNYKAAIADYNRAIEINPNYHNAYNNRGFAHRSQGNYEAAIADYNRAIEINPNYHNAYNNRGFAHRSQGNYKAAIADYNRAIEINPNYHNAYNNRGFAHRSQGNYEAAIADYNRAIEINPNYALAYNGRGLTHRRQGNYEAAIADYNRAIEINPNYHNAYNNRGFAHRSQGNYEAAIADYNRAIEINPNYALAYKNRGDAYKVLGEKQKAGSDWQTAANLYRKQDNNAGYQGAMNSLRSLQ